MKLTPEQLRVVHRDAHFLALDKPPGIATTAPHGAPSLFALAQQLDARAEQLHPLSRLDTQVSGLLVFARTVRANDLVLRARREGRLVRRYLGLSASAPPTPEGDWRWAIGLDPRDPKKRRALAPDAGGPGTKPAHTHYTVRATTVRVSALDLFPITGRTHQLRVHAAAASLPLLGDVAYAGAKRLTLDNGRILSAERVMLHCASLCAPHPDAEGGTLTLTLAPAADLLQLWLAAGGAADALG